MVTEDTNAAFAERFNAALDDIGVPPKGRGRQTETASMFGVSQKGARKWLEGEGRPTNKRLVGISEALGVNYGWLASGVGSKHPAIDVGVSENAAAYVARIEDVFSADNPHINELFRLLAQSAVSGALTDADAAVLCRMARGLLDEQNE